MIEYKQNQTSLFLVRLKDSSGNPITGVVFGGVTATINKSDGSTASVSPADSGHWTEITTGAFSGLGIYNLKIDSSNLNITGMLGLAVVGGGGSFASYYKVVANEVGDAVLQLTRALGMLHENAVLDQTAYDGFNNLTAGRLRMYDSKINALAASSTGLLHTYSIVATYVGQNMQTYTVVQES